MVVGPPGTGKTDTAVQIISNIYHNFPRQKILLITHSNAALNDLFEKMLECSIDGRHLLRLGAGEHELRESLLSKSGGAGGDAPQQGSAFNRSGRVTWCLERRLVLLAEVQRLGNSLVTSTNGVGEVGSTCEVAEYFYSFTVKPMITLMMKQLGVLKARLCGASNSKTTDTVRSFFAFEKFYSNVPDLFVVEDENVSYGIKSYERDMNVVMGCVSHIQRVFEELDDYRGFELLRTQQHRCDYMLVKQVR